MPCPPPGGSARGRKPDSVPTGAPSPGRNTPPPAATGSGACKEPEGRRNAILCRNRPQLNDRAYAGERPVIAVSSGIHAFPGSRSICGRTLSNPVRSDKAKGSSRPCESGFVAVLSVAERGFYRISRPGTAYGPKHPGRQKGSYAPEPCRITPIRALYSFRPCESGFVAVLSVAERVFYGISRPGTAYGSKHSGSQQDPCAPVRYRVSERFSPK